MCFLKQSMVDLLLCHPLQGLERGLHVGLSQAHQQSIVLHTNLVDGLTTALLQTPLQLRGQMLEAILSGIHQLQLRQGAERRRHKQDNEPISQSVHRWNRTVKHPTSHSVTESDNMLTMKDSSCSVVSELSFTCDSLSTREPKSHQIT